LASLASPPLDPPDQARLHALLAELEPEPAKAHRLRREALAELLSLGLIEEARRVEQLLSGASRPAAR